jgi:hypothetical protein
MPNITVLVSDEVYDIGRAYAKQAGTTLSALVADFLYTVRDQSQKYPRRTPRGVIRAHYNKLQKTPGRVNTEPRTLWDYGHAINALFDSMKNIENKDEK